jgi:hypothetical protein
MTIPKTNGFENPGGEKARVLLGGTGDTVLSPVMIRENPNNDFDIHTRVKKVGSKSDAFKLIWLGFIYRFVSEGLLR